MQTANTNTIFEEFLGKPRAVAMRQSNVDTEAVDEDMQKILTLVGDVSDNFSPDSVLMMWHEQRMKTTKFDMLFLDNISLLPPDRRRVAWHNLCKTHASNIAFPMLGIDDFDILKQAALLACETNDNLFFDVALSIEEVGDELAKAKVTALDLAMWEYAVVMKALTILETLISRKMIPAAMASRTVDDFAVFVGSRDNDRNKFLPTMEIVGRIHKYNPTWRYLPNELPLVERKEPLTDMAVRKSGYLNTLRLINETQEFVQLRAAFNKIKRSAPQAANLIDMAVVNEIIRLKKTDVQATLFFIAMAARSLAAEEQKEEDREYVLLAICSGLITHTSYQPFPNVDSAGYTVAEFAAITNDAPALRVLLEDERTGSMIEKEAENNHCIAEQCILALSADAFRVAKSLHGCSRCATEALRATVERVSKTTRGDEGGVRFAAEANKIIDNALSIKLALPTYEIND